MCLLRLILRTEIAPVVTSPGPMPGVAWTAAITARNFTATTRRAACRLLRSLLTEKPSLAASLGTFCVAEPFTVTVRSTALALAGSSRASATAASSDQGARDHLR